ncbi:MAG: signal recognition particle-docking protein FtsY [Actinomycetes bacterium]|jgi:fused signal recognition particle receptor|nr:signal recognition particle-docking protein FtsY [Actinomycetes bacterium]
MEIWMLVLIVAAILLVTVGLVAGTRRRRRLPPPSAPPAPSVVVEPGVATEPTVVVEPEARAEPVTPTRERPEPAVPTVERPEPAAGRLVRLRSRLARSNSALGHGLLTLLSRDSLDESTWEEIEDVLLSADLGVAPTGELVDRLRARARVEGLSSPDQARRVLREELLALVDPNLDRSLRITKDDRPSVVLVVGVNGTGKTTTTGKLARVLIADGHTVVLGAADTFRAAAADQLATWGSRVGARTVRGPEGADPASVAFDAVREGVDEGADVVLVDTAGRLHTKTGLMDELGKVKRVVEKHGPVDEVLLVLDATTGQNGMVQARVFGEVVDVTGIVLTKLDGTAKGGIVVTVQRELGVPVKLVGLGEGADDLAPFDPAEFVDALLA